MNIRSTISIYGGGPGSGCNPEAGKCGRPRKKDLSQALMKVLQDEPRTHRQFTLRQKIGVGGIHQVVKRMGDKLEVERRGKDVVVRMRRIPKSENLGDKESFLSTSPTSGSPRKLGGGVNETYTVKFENGDKAVFKVSETGDMNHEVAAWKIAKLVGMQDMVKPAVIRVIEGRTGSLTAWTDGEVAKNAQRDKKFDGKDDMFRAASFDYVIGNSDRHEKNWIVNGDKLGLIDHGIAFPRHGGPSWHTGFLEKTEYYAMKTPEDAPPSPRSLAGSYIEHRNEINTAMMNLKISEGRRQALQARIDNLSKADTWRELRRMELR